MKKYTINSLRYMLLSIVFVFAIRFIFWGMDISENSSVENAQAMILFCCIIASLFLALRENIKEKKIALFWLLWLSITFFLREVDVEDFDLPQIIISLFGKGFWRNFILSFSLIVWIYYAIKNVKLESKLFLNIFFSKPFLLLSIAAILLITGAIMEKNIFHMSSYGHIFYEETLELVGYIVMFFAIISIRKNLSLR